MCGGWLHGEGEGVYGGGGRVFGEGWECVREEREGGVGEGVGRRGSVGSERECGVGEEVYGRRGSVGQERECEVIVSRLSGVGTRVQSQSFQVHRVTDRHKDRRKRTQEMVPRRPGEQQCHV